MCRKLFFGRKLKRIANLAHRFLMPCMAMIRLSIRAESRLGFASGARVASETLGAPVWSLFSNDVVAEAAKFAVDTERPAAWRWRHRFGVQHALDGGNRFEYVAP